MPYWRKKGHRVKVFVTQYALGPALFWLFTEVDDISTLSKWSEMSMGDEEWVRIVKEFHNMMVSPGSIIIV